MARSSGNVSLQKYLKNADERVRQAAADALNEAATELENQIRSNMQAQGIMERTGALRYSLKATKATAKNPRTVIKSEVFVPAPKRPGSRNPKMRGRYRYGVPYGRVIEFSPRINRPFFYTAWYEKRREIRETVINKVSEAWRNGKN